MHAQELLIRVSFAYNVGCAYRRHNMVREVGVSEGDKAFKGPVKVRQSQQLLSECPDGLQCG